MSKRIRPLHTLAAAAAFGAMLAAPGPVSAGADYPPGGGANNVVVANANADRTAQVRAATQVTSVGGPTVGSTNLAKASATACTSCFATAVGVQTVFVTGDPQYFTPANVAAATNGGCTACGSFAYAWQYILQTAGPVYLNLYARTRVTQLRDEIDETAASIVPTDLEAALRLNAELDALTAELKRTVDEGIIAAGVVATPEVHKRAEVSLAGP